MTPFNSRTGLTLAGLVVLAGCAGNPEMQRKVTALEGQLSAAQSESSRLAGEVGGLRDQLASRDAEVEAARAAASSAEGTDHGYAALPPNPKAGHCYARVLVPPRYETKAKTILVQPESARIEVTDPVYEWVEERILTKEASKKAELVPAEYRWVEERVLVKEASSELVTIPPVYDTVTEQVLVREAHSEWKPGRGPIEKIDNLTGEIMCLVEVPAQYETVKKTVLVSPARTEKREIPAVYETVRKRVMSSPPRMVEIEIPAEYDTIKVRKLVRGPDERTITIPAEYRTVSETAKVEDGYLEWREILCETNTTPDVVRKLQQALSRAGYNPGPIDGVLGRETMAAVSAFQGAKSIPGGQLTLETLRELDVL